MSWRKFRQRPNRIAVGRNMDVFYARRKYETRIVVVKINALVLEGIDTKVVAKSIETTVVVVPKTSGDPNIFFVALV